MMNETLLAGMREATRLTRAGQLHEAMAMIQRTLHGGLGHAPAAEASREAEPDTIEGRCRVVDDEPGVTATPASPAAPHAASTGHARAHSQARPRPAAASHERTPPPRFGAGLHELLHERLRGQWRDNFSGYRGPMPWSEPLPDRPPIVVPDGARFITGTYANDAGTRNYKLYIPSCYEGQPLPLVVMLHGCTQGPDDFAAGTRMNEYAEEHRCFVAYPAQSQTANGSKCWNWFQAADQQRDRGEPSIIAGLTRQIADDHRIDGRRIYVAGLSAGGAMAMTLAVTYPDIYAAVGVHSGLPHAVAQDLPSALAAMRSGKAASPCAASAAKAPRGAAPVPAIVFHGDRDNTVHPCNGDQVIAQCAPGHAGRGAPAASGPAPRVEVQRGQVPHGHAYTRTVFHDADGQPTVEQWLVHGAGHAWSGGSSGGTYTDPKGPDATQEMLRFFYEHPQGEASTRVS